MNFRLGPGDGIGLGGGGAGGRAEWDPLVPPAAKRCESGEWVTQPDPYPHHPRAPRRYHPRVWP